MSKWEATHYDKLKNIDVIINPISLTEKERELERNKREHDFIVRDKDGNSWLQDIHYIGVK
jgi:hypothetical protein